MDKAPDAFRTISEVADDLDIPQHVLRFWETRFTQIKPMKRSGGRRYYRPDDVDLLRGIRRLLYGEGYTIRGVQRILREQSAKFVQAVWLEGAPQPPHVASDDEDLVEETVSPDVEVEERHGLRGRLTSLIGRDLGERQNAAEVVRRMAPFRGQPGVVEVEPADHRADVERRLHRIELKLRPRNPRAVGDDGARDDRAEELGARRIRQRFQAAPERVKQAVSCRVVRFLARDLVAGHVVGDVDKHLVGLGSNIGDRRGHANFLASACRRLQRRRPGFAENARHLRSSMGTKTRSSGPM